jgi:hypothetical protein
MFPFFNFLLALMLGTKVVVMLRHFLAERHLPPPLHLLLGLPMSLPANSEDLAWNRSLSMKVLEH